MTVVHLNDISNRGTASYPPPHRELQFDVRHVDDWWWVMTVHIPVRYDFVLPEHWGNADAFKRAFEDTSARAWSRRYLLRATRGVRVRTEVHVRLEEDLRQTANPRRVWYVIPFAPHYDGVDTHVEYDFTGYLPGRRGPNGEATGPLYRNIAMVQFTARDLDCNFEHLGYRARPAFEQRGADHEVGHMLGLQHPHCTGNQTACYGSNDTERASVMGHGSWVRPADYVWAQKAMELYTPRGWEIIDERADYAVDRGMCMLPDYRDPL